MDSDSDPGRTQPVLGLEHESTRRVLDAQARAWARTSRRWMWFGGLLGLTVVAAGVGFLLL